MFREKLREAPVAYTFRDVVLLPGYTEVEPSEVDLSTYFTRNLRLQVPLVSSPMDTVTEERMAIALARLGAAGVLHRNCSREREVEMARTVKEAGEEVEPVPSVKLETRVSEALDLMRRYGVDILVVTDEEGRYLGVLHYVHLTTADPTLPVATQLLRDYPVVKTPYTVGEVLDLMRRCRVRNLPLVTSDGKYVGILTVELLSRRRTGVEPSRGKDGRLLCAAAISPFDLERAKMLDKYVDVLVIDVAHFHNRNCIEATRRLVKEVSADIVVGNIGTYEAAEDVLTKIERVDALRVGISSGSICTTGEVTGVAAPTLFAVAEVADAVRDYGAKVPIIADGGVRNAGDAAKALAAGAWLVMVGYMLAGCDESPSPIIVVEGRKYKYYRGMGSLAARARRYVEDRYTPVAKHVPEGVEALVPYRGPVAEVIREFTAALRAAMGYVGARNIPEMWEKARFALLTPLGAEEVRPHSVRVLQ